ncbi:hypothetical protein [Wohlfahrtiimonas populi]|uniref:hypothetical protein n=1 Tax=Wohlfahrtiimonas populi TaxID=1940240 RepID=UPI00098D0D73|nr:hypothetical protein [Wohlfahrtiimonas populi]
MKIITILSLCLTASLSFVHSETLDKTNDNIFTYDYSQVCADTKNCIFPATFDALYKKTYSFFDIYDFTECTNSEFITDVHDIPPCPIQYKDLSIKKYGFSSKTDANAYLNILDPIPSPQISSLGNSRSIIFDFNISINQDASIIEIQQNQYMLGFGAKKVKRLGQLTNPKLLNIIQEPNNQSIFRRRFTLVYEHANKEICPQVFKLNFIYLIPIQPPSKIYAQTNQDGSYSIMNQNENEKQAFICPKIPDEIRSIADLEKKYGCQRIQLAPSSSIEIKPQE